MASFNETTQTIHFDTDGRNVYGIYEIPVDLENEYGMTRYTLEVYIERDSRNVSPFFDEVEWDEVSVISVI